MSEVTVVQPNDFIGAPEEKQDATRVMECKGARALRNRRGIRPFVLFFSLLTFQFSFISNVWTFNLSRYAIVVNPTLVARKRHRAGPWGFCTS